MERKKAFQIIIIFGLVSLFGDIIYEGARSVNGPFLNVLGASAAAVGLISGIGEFLGYVIRLASGYLSDKTRARWFFVITGYAMLVSVPLLSLAGHWQLAVCFIILERIGKAVRSPARDTIVSEAAKEIGTGWGFGIMEAMDQVGALTGPLIFTGLFLIVAAPSAKIADYQFGYSLLWAPFLLLLACVFFAYRRFPNKEVDVVGSQSDNVPERFSKLFWLYIGFSFVATAGFVNFILLGYHFKVKHVFSDAFIPLMYAIAMGVDGVAALIIGKAYDILKRKSRSQSGGLEVLVIIPVLSTAMVICAFSRNIVMAVVSMILWGIVMGAHETIMKSAIADIAHIRKRSTGYGIFNTGYGLAMLLGSVLVGLLYERSLWMVIGAVIIIEAVALFLFFLMRRQARIARV
jgi:MFS family permease